MYGFLGYGPLADVLTAIFENFLLSCMGIYALVLARRAWRTLAAMPQLQRAAQRLPVMKRTVKRFAVVYLVWWVGLSAFAYYSVATSRRDVRDCKRFTSLDYKDYYVDECPFGHGYGENDVLSLIRLYSAGTDELLAEEITHNAEGELRWENTRFDGRTGRVPSKPYINQPGYPGVKIELDPPWWQRMRAQLP